MTSSLLGLVSFMWGGRPPARWPPVRPGPKLRVVTADCHVWCPRLGGLTPSQRICTSAAPVPGRGHSTPGSSSGALLEEPQQLGGKAVVA
jgi:hypothetical protein